MLSLEKDLLTSTIYNIEDNADIVFDISDKILKDYLEDLVTAQGAVLVDSKEEADTVLRIEKAEDEKEISLMDSNFFMDKATNDKLCKEYEEKEADKGKDSELEK